VELGCFKGYFTLGMRLVMDHLGYKAHTHTHTENYMNSTLTDTILTLYSRYTYDWHAVGHGPPGIQGTPKQNYMKATLTLHLHCAYTIFTSFLLHLEYAYTVPTLYLYCTYAIRIVQLHYTDTIRTPYLLYSRYTYIT
jgi:hypothetical protein